MFMKSLYDLYTGKPGIVFTPYERCMNVLTLYGGGELVDKENVKITDDLIFGEIEDRVTFYKIKVKDLRQAYLILDDTMTKDIGWLFDEESRRIGSWSI